MSHDEPHLVPCVPVDLFVADISISQVCRESDQRCPTNELFRVAGRLDFQARKSLPAVDVIVGMNDPAAATVAEWTVGDSIVGMVQDVQQDLRVDDCAARRSRDVVIPECVGVIVAIVISIVAIGFRHRPDGAGPLLDHLHVQRHLFVALLEKVTFELVAETLFSLRWVDKRQAIEGDGGFSGRGVTREVDEHDLRRQLTAVRRDGRRVGVPRGTVESRGVQQEGDR